ncbi:hypothetical protein A2U01_0033773, partial [Trifolium medium]|nr:hypothetical protein [Trifolium medium]
MYLQEFVAATTLDDRTIEEYFSHIKMLIDALASVGDPEVEALLLVHKMCLQKFKKLLQSETAASTNLTQSTSNAETAS